MLKVAGNSKKRSREASSKEISVHARHQKQQQKKVIKIFRANTNKFLKGFFTAKQVEEIQVSTCLSRKSSRGTCTTVKKTESL